MYEFKLILSVDCIQHGEYTGMGMANKCMRLNDSHLTQGINYISFSVPELKGSLDMHLSNKSSNGTVIDNNNQIIEDTYVRCDGLIMNNLVVDKNFLPALFNITPTDSTIKPQTTNYWGFNGIVSLDITASDPLDWHLKAHIKGQEFGTFNHLVVGDNEALVPPERQGFYNGANIYNDADPLPT